MAIDCMVELPRLKKAFPHHIGRLTTTWLEQPGIQYMRWPANLLYMNLIESVWGEIMRQLHKHPPEPLPPVQAAVLRIWQRIRPVTDTTRRDYSHVGEERTFFGSPA